MTALSPTQEQQKGRGVVTNGIGQPCTSHLNLTVSMADQVAAEKKPERPEQPRIRIQGVPDGWPT